MLILRPENSAVNASCCQDDAISHWNPILRRDPGRGQGKLGIQIHPAPTHHHSDSLQRLTLAALLQNALEHFVHADRRHNQLRSGFDGRRKEVGIRPGQRMQVIQYEDRIELVPIRPTHEMRGFLKGIDTTIEREPDRV